MANTVTTTTISDEIKTHYIMRLLMRAIPRLIHGRWSQKATIPRRTGNTAEWRKFGALTVTAGTVASDFALTETAWGHGGTPQTPQSVSVTPLTASPAFYGAYIEYTDDIDLLAIDSVVENFSDLLGEQAGRVADLLTRAEMVSNLTTVVRPGTVASDGAVTASNIMDFPLFVKACATLQANDALPIAGDRYVMITHPHVIADMLQDDTIHKAFQTASDAENRNPFATGYIGSLLNVDIYATSHAYIDADAGAGNVDVYYSIFLGQEAYGTLGIEGKQPRDVDMASGQNGSLTGNKVRPVDLIMKPLGYKDPLDEIGTIAWKLNHAAKVLNAAFAVVARHASSLGTNT